MASQYEKYKTPQRYFSNDYLEMLVTLLPEGLIWVYDKFVTGYVIQDAYGDQDTSWQDTSDSLEAYQDTPLEEGASGNLLRRLLSCFGSELERIDAAITALVNQTDPGVSVELLSDHEEQLGLPESCLANVAMTLAERQEQAHVKMFKRGQVLTKTFYEDLADSLGFDITVEEVPLSGNPRRMGVARMGVERMGGFNGNAIIRIIINSSPGDNNLLKCVVEQLKPAHVYIEWIEKVVAITTTKAGDFTVTMQGSGTVRFDWGDGNIDEYALSGASTDAVYTYPDASEKTVRISGDVDQITLFDARTQNLVTGLGTLKYMSSIEALYLQNNAIADDIEVFADLHTLQTLSAFNTSLSGDVDALVGLTALNVLYLLNTDVGCAATVPALDGANVRFDSCGWTSTEVDNFILEAVDAGMTNCTINIAGSNAARTTASDAALATLMDPSGLNNAVTVNE